MTTLTNLQKLKLLVGDVALDFPFLADDTYNWLLELYPNDLNKAAAEALEMIINQISLAPQSVRTEDITEVAPLVASLEIRLNSLKAKANSVGKKFPMIIKSDRTDWDDINSLYGKNQ